MCGGKKGFGGAGPLFFQRVVRNINLSHYFSAFSILRYKIHDFQIFPISDLVDKTRIF